jgi:hypothetical protein
MVYVKRRADCNRWTEMNRAADRQPIHRSRRAGIRLQVAVFFPAARSALPILLPGPVDSDPAWDTSVR